VTRGGDSVGAVGFGPVRDGYAIMFVIEERSFLAADSRARQCALIISTGGSLIAFQAIRRSLIVCLPSSLAHLDMVARMADFCRVMFTRSKP
jgi:hypothetical protein